MRRYALLIGLLPFALHAHTPPPQDPLHKELIQGVGYWQNLGQLMDEFGEALDGFRFYSDGVLPRTGFQDGGRLTFVREVLSTDSLIPDTLYRADLIPVHAQPVEPIGVDSSFEYTNFYLPHTMPTGAEFVHRFGMVFYPDLWPGISMWVYPAGHEERIAFVCAPGSDPSMIKFQFEGQESAVLDANGRTVLHLGSGDLIIPAPVIYQYDAAGLEMLSPTAGANMDAAATAASGSGGEATEYTPPLVGHDPAKTMVVLFGEGQQDMERGSGIPGLCWSTYFGGNRFDAVTESATDQYDSYYITGWTRSSILTFPFGFFDPVILVGGPYLAFLTKFDKDEILMWRALVGAGTGSLIFGKALAIREGASNSIYMGGLVHGPSPNLFTYAAAPAYFDGTGSQYVANGFITRFSETGTIQWSTYWGDDTAIEGMAISARRLVVVGATKVPLATPTTPLAAPATYLPPNLGPTDSGDAYAAMFSTLDEEIWLCYLGGSNGDDAFDVRSLGKSFYIFGWTQSDDFPIVPMSGAYNDPIFDGGTMAPTDAFLVQFDADAQLIWSTYFGGKDSESPGRNGLALSPVNGDVYIVGSVLWTQPAPSGFPLMPNANGIGYFDGVKDPGSNGFIARFNKKNALKWCTYFGAYNYFHYLETATVDKFGGAYVGGETASPALPVMQSTNYAYFQPIIEPNDGLNNDGFIALFKPTDDVLNWCTYFGGKAGVLPEFIHTLLAKETSLFAAGRTSKFTDVNSFFPLQDNMIPGSFFDPFFGDPQSSPTTDGFLTKFCTPWSSFTEDPYKSRANSHTDESVRWWISADELCFVTYLPADRVQLISLDGRTHMDKSINTVDLEFTSGCVPLAALPPGLFIAKLNSGETFKFVRP